MSLWIASAPLGRAAESTVAVSRMTLLRVIPAHGDPDFGRC